MNGRCLTFDFSCSRRLQGKWWDVLHNRSKDGRPWKSRDSQTKWREFDSVRYKNCNGQLKCTNTECAKFTETGMPNRLEFSKDGMCNFCGVQYESLVPCAARKYVAKKHSGSDILTLEVYHVGDHTCQATDIEERPTGVVGKAIAENPRITPAQIQTVRFMKALRERKSWEEIKEGSRKLHNKTAISNEKKKQVHFRIIITYIFSHTSTKGIEG